MEEKTNNWINLHKNNFLSKNLKEKYVKQRIKHGYSEYDVWNMSNYFLEVIPSMLRYLAEHTSGYPDGFGGFKDMQQWQKYLEETASHFELAREDIEENPYENEFHKIVKKWTINDRDKNGWFRSYIAKEGKDEVDAIVSKYSAKQQEIYDNRKHHLHQGLKMLEEHFFDLWD